MILCGIAFPMLPIIAQDNVIDEVVWVVGDEAILKSDVEEARIYFMASGQKMEGDPYCVIPEQLAIQKLFLHQAELDSIEVTDAEVIRSVDAEIDARINQIGSREKMEEYFDKTTTQIREQLRETVRDRMLVEQVQKKLFGNIQMTPAEVRRGYAMLKEEEIPFVPTQVEVQIITQQPEIPFEEIERVKAELRDYTERVQNGEAQFSTLAVFYSEDKESARRGGEIDFFGRGEMVPEFSAVAFNLTEPGKISKIVETEYGFHIIQLVEKRGDRIKVRHILRKPDVSDESMQASMLKLDSIANDIRTGKFSFDEASILSADKDTRKNFGLMHNMYTGSAKFELQQLPQEVARAIYTMNIGEISRPFTMIDTKTGKEVCAIVKLKSKTEAHRATPTEDFQTIKDVLIAKEREKKMEKWIVEKQNTTYIRINENWCDCDFQYPGWVKQ